ncbi:MAG: winged helix-turn-helix domain-containing protein [Lachnospiraceae bacterium]|nr:winged helix-turn-helix domain-containing protein [Lachnospiraceae bacterium]
MGRALLIEFDDNDIDAFDEIMAVLKSHPEFAIMRIEGDFSISFSKLVINFKQRKVYSDQSEIALTAKEYDILRLLVINKGNALSHEQIYEKIWISSLKHRTASCPTISAAGLSGSSQAGMRSLCVTAAMRQGGIFCGFLFRRLTLPLKANPPFSRDFGAV